MNTPETTNASKDSNKTVNNSTKENTMNTPEAIATTATETKTVVDPNALYERVLANNTTRRTSKQGDPNGAFSKMGDLIRGTLNLCTSKKIKQVPVRNLINTALESGWFDHIHSDQRYNRCYNYLIHNCKSNMPSGWKREKRFLDGKEVAMFVYEPAAK